jgi:hypothetical protein
MCPLFRRFPALRLVYCSRLDAVDDIHKLRSSIFLANADSKAQKVLNLARERVLLGGTRR